MQLLMHLCWDWKACVGRTSLLQLVNSSLEKLARKFLVAGSARPGCQTGRVNDGGIGCRPFALEAIHPDFIGIFLSFLLLRC